MSSIAGAKSVVLPEAQVSSSTAEGAGPLVSVSVPSSSSTSSVQTRQIDIREEPSVITTLFSIIQNRDLTDAERNLRFVQELGKVQLAAFKRITLQTEFSAQGLTFAMSSANTALPRGDSEVTAAGLPFYVLDRNVQRVETSTALKVIAGMPSVIADLALSYFGTHIDFRSVVLSPALQTEINQGTSPAQKALVPVVRTLQEWAHSDSRGYGVTIPDPMPDITSEAYSLVTFVPVKTDGAKKIGQWDPFFKGPNGPKIMLTYINDETSQEAQGGATGFLSSGNYIPLQDSTKKKHNWSVEPITAEEASTAATVAKVKKAAVNFAIIPINPMDPPPVMRSLPATRSLGATRGSEEPRYRSVRCASAEPSYGRVGVGQQTAQTYSSHTVHGRHRVEAEQTVHVQVRPIPIDVSGIESEEALDSYLRSLGKMVVELAEIGGEQAVALSQERQAVPQPSVPTSVPAVATTTSVTSMMPVATNTSLVQSLTDGMATQVNWHRNYWSSLLRV